MAGADEVSVTECMQRRSPGWASAKTVLAMIDYIHNHPVRRSLVSRPEQWEWSSAGWYEGKNPLRPDVIDFGGSCLLLGGKG